MKPLETKRLVLREFEDDDFASFHSYANCAENIVYVVWGPSTEEQTRAFISTAIKKANEVPCTNYQYAAVTKGGGKLIGGCNLTLFGGIAEMGWFLHHDYWKQGYGTEIGKALLKFGFEELKLQRIQARCDADNIGSFRVMEKIGMRCEGLFPDSRPAHKLSDRKFSDELSYFILRNEWGRNKRLS